MLRQDVPKLFDLLEQLYQKKKPRDEVTIAIWAEVLKPWSYEQVRAAVIERARKNCYFPNPSEIAEYLPKRNFYYIAERSRKKEAEQWQKEFEQWHEELKQRGLPTLEEALETGMTSSEWVAVLKEAGAWD